MSCGRSGDCYGAVHFGRKEEEEEETWRRASSCWEESDGCGRLCYKAYIASMCWSRRERRSPVSLSWGVMEECIIRGHHSSLVPTDTRVTQHQLRERDSHSRGKATTKNEGTSSSSIVSGEKERERKKQQMKSRSVLMEKNIVMQEIPEKKIQSQLLSHNAGRIGWIFVTVQGGVDIFSYFPGRGISWHWVAIEFHSVRSSGYVALSVCLLRATCADMCTVRWPLSGWHS